MTPTEKLTTALQLLRELGLSERQLAVVRAMLITNETGGRSEYEIASEHGDVSEEPER
jgi:hypothetical protein